MIFTEKKIFFIGIYLAATEYIFALAKWQFELLATNLAFTGLHFNGSPLFNANFETVITCHISKQSLHVIDKSQILSHQTINETNQSNETF